MPTKIKLSGLLCLLFIVAGPAAATTVTYGLTNISGNTWQYSFSVSNDSLMVDIEEFTIYFDYTAYENLAFPASPATWDPLVVQPDTGLPDNGFYDALLFSGSGIGSGQTLGGFTVQFDYLGAGTPGTQYFEIVDPNTFAAIDNGQTTAETIVPVPSALWLFASGLFGMMSRIRSASRRFGAFQAT